MSKADIKCECSESERSERVGQEDPTNAVAAESATCCDLGEKRGKCGMDMRVKELIAIGASITANCQPCLDYHVARARENGAEEAEITEAIAVGRIVRRGASGKMDRYADEMLRGTAAKPDDKAKGDGCELT
jgi:AhpD family alkylhydroperoxidase